MNFADYLAFIQVSVAFNFASAYWKKENDDDAIEKLFRVFYDNKKLEQGLEKNQRLMSSIDQHRPVITDTFHEEIEIDKKALSLFYEMKDKWTKATQNILNIYIRVMSTDRSVFFNNVCIVMALYGLFQLWILPDICEKGYEVFRNAYIYATEILLGILGVLFLSEIVFKFKGLVIKIPHLCSIVLFLFLAIGTWLFSYLYSIDSIKPYYADFNEDKFIYYSIFIPYFSYIVYFLITVMFVVWDWILMCFVVPYYEWRRRKAMEEYEKK
ncbi:MAG: hypothetical protein E7095_02090 [Bacteroides sp.]|nr:hypothetical protein [Bacteroides sp.]